MVWPEEQGAFNPTPRDDGHRGRCDGHSHTQMAVTMGAAKCEQLSSGGRGFQLARCSKSIVQIEGPNGQLVSVCPFILNSKFTLWEREAISQRGPT